MQCSCTSQLVEVLQSSQASLTSEVPEDIPFDARPIEENSVALEGEAKGFLSLDLLHIICTDSCRVNLSYLSFAVCYFKIDI